MGVVQAIDFLAKPDKYELAPFCVVAGEEAFLRREVVKIARRKILGDGDADYSLVTCDGTTATFVDVLRDVSTVVLFGAGKRLVVVEQAEAFLSQYRDKLEDYVSNPSVAGSLFLVLNSFPSNTRLYKKVAEKGVIFDCKTLSSKVIAPWLIEWSKRSRNAVLNRESAELLVELIGDDLGILDQEVQKLALLSGDDSIGVNLVQENVGSQRQRKVWDLVDAALDGRTAEALRQLNALLNAGEAPIAILAQMSATLRKLAAAAQLFLEADPSKPPMTVYAALDAVGVKPFVRQKTGDQLKKLGSRRAKSLEQSLLQADLDMKGGSRSDPRLILERFIVRISHPQMRPFESLR